MRDVSTKPNSLRTAKARAVLRCASGTIDAIRSGNLPKADPIPVARVAAIQAAKNTSLLIPYCHQVPLDFVDVQITPGSTSIEVLTEVKAVWKTGVEMEALAAATAAVLTLYDMLKIIDDTMAIDTVQLLEKRGGKSDNPPDLSKYTTAVIVLSDLAAAGKREDRSGKALRDRITSLHGNVVRFEILPDDATKLERLLIELCDGGKVDVVFTTGGTGAGPRDITTETTRRVIDKELTGIGEFLRRHGQERMRYAMFSRALGGIRGKTVVVNLPGSTAGVNESLDVLLPWVYHAIEMARGGGHEDRTNR